MNVLQKLMTFSQCQLQELSKIIEKRCFGEGMNVFSSFTNGPCNVHSELRRQIFEHGSDTKRNSTDLVDI